MFRTRVVIPLVVLACILPVVTWAGQITRINDVADKPTVVAIDRVQWLTGENPQSTKLAQEERFVRLGFGAFMWQALCGSQPSCIGNFTNLSIIPNGGVNVVVQPAVSNTIGTLYQFLPEETTPMGGYPSGVGVFLQPDPTKVMIQGTLATATAGIGPLSPPLTTGQSTNYLIECQILTVDTTSQPINIVSPGGSVTPTSANRDRADTVNCTAKPGIAALTGSQATPTVDSGYVGIGRVSVAFGTVNITAGMISANAPLAGNVFLSPATPQTGFVSIAGPITSSTSVAAPVLIAGNGYVPPTLSVSGGVTLPTEHSIHGQVTSPVVLGQPCSTIQYVTLSGAAAMTSAATYSVVGSVDYTASTVPSNWPYANSVIAQRISATSFGIQTCGVATAASTGSMVLTYIVSGY